MYEKSRAPAAGRVFRPRRLATRRPAGRPAGREISLMLTCYFNVATLACVLNKPVFEQSAAVVIVL